MRIIKTLGLTALALLVAGNVVTAAPAGKYTFIHYDAKGHAKVLSLDCDGVRWHYTNHPDEQCENWVAYESCNPV